MTEIAVLSHLLYNKSFNGDDSETVTDDIHRT
jgi:hypothetical protein